MMNDYDIKEEVTGRWAAIFSYLGVNVGDGRHVDCPMCGRPGKKPPFRFDDIDGTGSWICGYCGAGDGWSLLMKKFNLDFPAAIEEVKKIVHSCPRGEIRKERLATPEMLRSVFEGSAPISRYDVAGLYLSNRGLKEISPTLRYSPKCWELETKKNQKAMLAIFTEKNGKAITIHRTYLNEDSEKLGIESPRKIMPSLGYMPGGAVRLFPHTDVLGVAEGVETALAAKELFHIPVWATLSSANLEAFEPPQGLRILYVFGDNDKGFVGQKAAYTLAWRAKRLKIPQVLVDIPDVCGWDQLDVLNDKKGTSNRVKL
jgi:putative DNA primase/helicase